jgi:hypothetical protein
VVQGTTVSLDGSASSDLDGDTLAFAWTVDAAPTGSTASPSNATQAVAALHVDLPGTYDLTLTVSDGRLEDTASVRLEVAHVPIADAGPDQTVDLGQELDLSGAGSSDPEGHTLTYHWSWVSRPPGSQAEIVGADDPATAVEVSFVADVAGTYTLKLEVHDGDVVSRTDVVNVIARVPSTP